jgi:hypothetical protein
MNMDATHRDARVTGEESEPGGTGEIIRFRDRLLRVVPRRQAAMSSRVPLPAHVAAVLYWNRPSNRVV